MPTLNIEGQRVTVGDDFLKLSPEQQNATVEEISRSLPKQEAPPDKYQLAAAEDLAKVNAAGTGLTGELSGLVRRGLQGVTLGAADDISAAISTPAEMYRRGTFNPAEGYRYAKAYEDAALNQARENTGLLGTAAEIAGGVGTGYGLMRAGIGAGAALAPNAGLGARTVASTVDSAALGGIAGLMEGNSLEERGANALRGALIGGGVGAVAPAALAAGGAAISPIVSNIRALNNPSAFARSQVARAVTESGRTTDEIGQSLQQAANEGQGMFTLADALGNPGQRMLSTVTRAPGSGRTDVLEFLDARQAGQSRRVANQLADGFDAPQTAAQTERRLTQARTDAADAEYGAVRADAGAVDLTRVIDRIDQTLAPGAQRVVTSRTNIADDSVESALQKIRNKLTDDRSNLTDFAAIQRVRGDLSDDIEAAVRAGKNHKAGMLRNVRTELDNAMEQASEGFRQANRNFEQASRNIDAVDIGRTAATRGRTEDTIPAFQALTPEGQGAFRAGYVDPLIGTAQGSAFGANAARPLTSAAFNDEAAAIAANAPRLARQIARENTMFQTRNASVGNSKTIENAADDAAMGVDPTLVGMVLSGNWNGAARNVIAAGSNAVTGNTPAVRAEVGRLLLARGQMAPQQLDDMVSEAIARIQAVQQAARETGRGAAGGLAVTPGATKKSRKLSRKN